MSAETEERALDALIRAIASRYAIAGAVRGRGLLYCLDFVDPATGGPLTPAQPLGRSPGPSFRTNARTWAR